MQLPAREQRLDHVPGVHRSLGRPGPDDRVHLVDEGDHLASGLGDLLQDGLQPLLELAAILRSGDHPAEVERDHALVLQSFRHIAGDDALRETLDDRRLSHAGLADQDRVVLRPSRQDLDHAADLVVAADHRVELAFSGEVGEVAAVLLQRVVGLFRVLRGHALVAPHLDQRFQDRVPRDAAGLQQRRHRPGHLGEREQDVLGRDVVVLQRPRLLLGAFEDAHERRRRGGGNASATRVRLRDAVDQLVDLVAQRTGGRAEPLHEREYHTLRIGEQAVDQMLGLDRLLVARRRQRLRRGDRLL